MLPVSGPRTTGALRRCEIGERRARERPLQWIGKGDGALVAANAGELRSESTTGRLRCARRSIARLADFACAESSAVGAGTATGAVLYDLARCSPMPTSLCALRER